MISQSEVRESLYTSLKELGLTESESNLYITSLSLGPTTIAALAESLAIPRPNVYKVIAELERHGLARFSDKKRFARTFVVEPPTTVLEQLRIKREAMGTLDQTLVGAMPDLLALYRQGEAPSKIRIFNGEKEWLKIFFQVLDEAKNSIDYFGSADAFINLVTWEKERQWITERVKKNISMRTLLTPGQDATILQSTDAKDMRTTKIFQGAMPFVTGFMLYANKVIIWQPKAPLVMLIEDEYIVQMLRSIFTSLWSQTEKSQ